MTTDSSTPPPPPPPAAVPPAPAASTPKRSRWRRLRFHSSKASASAVASSAAQGPHGDVLKQGFLLKKGHRLPTTKQRYFVLQPQLLSYFRPKHGVSVATDANAVDAPPPVTDARHLKGVIELAPSDLVTPVATSRHWFLVQKLSGPDGKSYKLELRASSPEERQQWIDAIRAATRHGTASTAAQTAREAERVRQLTRTFTMLRVRDASLLSTVLRTEKRTQTSHPLVSSPSAVDLRASFQTFHELVLLQALVTQIQNNWGPPDAWTCDQYDALVESVALAQHQSQSQSQRSARHDGDGDDDASVLRVARALQYAFEEIPDNQHKLLARQRAASAAVATQLLPPVGLSLHGSFVSGGSGGDGRLRCPTIYSYLSTFERLAHGDSDQRLSSDSERSSSLSSASTAGTSARSSLTDGGSSQLLSPRSATLAKYAHLYLEEEGRHRRPWSWERVTGDELFESEPLAQNREKAAAADELTTRLANRFDHGDRIYSYLRHHTLLFVNPNRVLKTNKFTSIYDEQVVLVYAQTPFAQTQLAPHPFAMAKQALLRLFFSGSKRQSMVLSGDSGSGKTELAKELLKYTVLTAQPAAASRHVVLYTSSTKSTLQMRNEETRTLDLLHAKGVTDYAVVLLDLAPEKWAEMTSVSKSKRLPQVHIDGLFFGFYETLQRLEDEEQLRMYFYNPHVAHQLSSVLDSNILLEAFAHASTPLNANSSRYAKRVEIHVVYGRDPAQYQVVGCEIAPFLLEKSRVTASSGQRNFHVLYALVHGVDSDGALARVLHLEGTTSASFKYLSDREATSLPNERSDEWKRKKDAERFSNITAAMETVAMDAERREAIFRVLSAVLWLGNLDFTDSKSTSGGGGLELAGATAKTEISVAQVLHELLALESPEDVNSLLLIRRVEMASTGETFHMQLGISQARFLRDTVARFLYQMVFQFVVNHVNRTTQCPPDMRSSARSVSLVDMFGFENFVGSGQVNSLEQLCVNYMTEKLAAAEQQLVALHYHAGAPISALEPAVLYLFEHPLGIFATLEEQTVLHQSEGDASASAANEQKKNELFVRYLYQRNQAQLAAQPSQLKQHTLQFLVPHSRDLVTYDALDFVKKNSDFQQLALLHTLEKSQNATIQAMVQLMKQQQQHPDSGASRSSARGPVVGSLTTQFRTEIQRQVGLFHEPLFLHCFRPSASTTWSGASHVDPENLCKQLRAHRIPQIVQLCADKSSAFEVSVDANLFQTRYNCLLEFAAEPARTSVGTLCELLETTLRAVLDLSSTNNADERLLQADANATANANADSVRVRSLQIAETLELLLATRHYEAATRLQACVRMVRTRRWYHALQSDRRALTHELLALYGPSNPRKIERTLRKYQGRESDLMAKIAAKKAEKAAIAEIASGMESYMAQTGSSGLDPQLLEQVLRDREIQRQIAQSESRIVAALREMSLNPQQVLPKQLADPELRAFYQRMLMLMRQLVTDRRQQQQQQQMQDASEDMALSAEASLEDRVRRLVAKYKPVWRHIARQQSQVWAEAQDRLDEIADEPEMLLFYADDDAFVAVLTGFVESVETAIKAGGLKSSERDGSIPSEEEEKSGEDLVEKLTNVEFSATLMAAMQGDPFFVDALQSPHVVTAVHQLMTNREAFVAAHGGLRSPLLREFFHRLVRLSEETRRHQ